MNCFIPYSFIASSFILTSARGGCLELCRLPHLLSQVTFLPGRLLAVCRPHRRKRPKLHHRRCMLWSRQRTDPAQI
jgi:hypothetical protein